MSKSKILFLMTGSIACYKACSLISKLVQNNCEVQVAASPSALQFVGAATLEGLTGKPVVSDMYETGKMMAHINLIRDCDLVICAPATAHYINRIAQGIGDDLMSTLFLAHDFERPFLIAPAMNTKMYLHPVTQGSIKKLKDMEIQILETESGVLACGEIGSGKLLDPDLMFDKVQKALKKEKSSKSHEKNLSVTRPLRILVTAGGTTEAIDDVRVLSNRSTGKTATRLANSFAELGADVTLLKSKSSSEKSFVKHELLFESFEDLQNALKSELSSSEYDFVLHAAAVSDFSVEKMTGKISSQQETLELKLKRNPKLIGSLAEWSKNKNLQVIGFKLTSGAVENERTQAVQKVFTHPQVTCVVHNDMKEINSGQHIFRLFYQDKSAQKPNSEVTTVEDLALELSRLIFQKGKLT